MAGRVRVLGPSDNLIPVPVPDFWLSEKIRTRTHIRLIQVLFIKVKYYSSKSEWIQTDIHGYEFSCDVMSTLHVKAVKKCHTHCSIFSLNISDGE